MGQAWEKTKAELAAYGRYGLQDAQRLVLGEWHGSTPSQAGMMGTITPAEADRQLNEPDKEQQPDVNAPEPEVQEPDEPEMG